jgi:hypothetical protein
MQYEYVHPLPDMIKIKVAPHHGTIIPVTLPTIMQAVEKLI